MLKTLVVTAALACPTALWAQEGAVTEQPEDPWAISVELSPVFGNEMPEPWGQTTIDEAEYSLSGSYTRNLPRGLAFKTTIGASVSPDQYNVDDRSSAAFLKADLRRTINMTNFADRPTQDAYTPFATYKVVAGYGGTFDEDGDTSHTVSFGVNLQDVRSYMCLPRNESVVTVLAADERCRSGRVYSITPQVDWVRSTDPDADLFSPSLTAIYSHPLPYGVDVSLKVVGSGQMFASQQATGGGDREDWRLSGTLSFNVTRPLAATVPHWPEGLTVSLGARVSRQWSNLDGKDFTRRFFVPSIQWARSF